MTQKEWLLYLDETGRKDSKDDNFAVVGLLFEKPENTRWEVELKSRLTRALPMIPWPMHAYLLRIPLMYALWHARKPMCGVLKPLKTVGPLAIEYLKTHFPDELTYFVDDLSISREPSDFSRIKKLDRTLLFKNPALHKHLSAIAVDARTTIKTLMAEALNGPAASRVVTLAARLKWEPNSLGQDDYLSSLHALYQRTHDGLNLLGGSHKVMVHAANLFVHDPTFDKRTMLNRNHLLDAAKSIETSDDSNIQFLLGGTYDFDDMVPAGIVIADYIANSLYNVIGYATLHRMRCWVHAHNDSAIDCGSPPLPMVSAIGTAQNATDNARNGQNPPGQTAIIGPPWIREQTQNWVDHFTHQNKSISGNKHNEVQS